MHWIIQCQLCLFGHHRAFWLTWLIGAPNHWSILPLRLRSLWQENMLSILTCLSVVMHDHAKANVVCLLAHISSWVACKMVVTTVNGVRSSSFISNPHHWLLKGSWLFPFWRKRCQLSDSEWYVGQELRFLFLWIWSLHVLRRLSRRA